MATQINPFTGFYAVVKLGKSFRTIESIGYRPGSNMYIPGLTDPNNVTTDANGRVIVQPDPSDIWGSVNPIDWNDANKIREPFESFLRTMYAVEIELTGTEPLSGLYEPMRKRGVLSQCGGVEVVDFMAFTDAIERFQVLPNGEQIDCLNINPGDPRPLVADLRRKDDSLMWEIIEFLGLQGMVPYLFAGGGITFKQLCDYLTTWIPDPDERELYLVEVLRPALRSKNHPVLSFDQIQQLLK